MCVVLNSDSQACLRSGLERGYVLYAPEAKNILGKSISSLHATKATQASSKCAVLNSQAYDRDWNVVNLCPQCTEDERIAASTMWSPFLWNQVSLWGMR